MKAVITAVGCDRIGIIAGISKVLAEKNVNIMDITQTIMQEYFTMTMLVDISKASVQFNELKESIEEEGRELKISILIQREEIFKSMHRI
ncbi:MAG: ACT domain-containing protein [Clostridiales bacterium]|nr:ACT domain-containing protein [Clostridiales bacterium]